MSLRVSQKVSKEISGNAGKYEAYREAWSRIKSAQENLFFLEAITIQESIISDRIISFLSHSTEANQRRRDNSCQYLSLYKLIERWRAEFPNTIKSGKYQDLINALNEWRLARNETIHAIVKSNPADISQDIDLFLKKAKETAEEGEQIAREICNWCKRTKNSNHSKE